MNTANFSIARFNNIKENLLNLGKKNKTNYLKINIIMDNIAKIRKNNNLNFSNNKDNPKRENKRGKRFYKNNNNNKKKYGSLNQINIIKKLNFGSFNY